LKKKTKKENEKRKSKWVRTGGAVAPSDQLTLRRTGAEESDETPHPVRSCKPSILETKTYSPRP
jgi:hypothetical protein